MLGFRLVFLMILLAAPAYGESRFGGFHGRGFHGGGFHGGLFPRHHRGGRAPDLLLGYAYGYNCGFNFDCGGYDYDYGYGYGDGPGYGSGYSSDGARNAGSGGATRNATSSGGFSGGGYVPDPVGAEIPPMIFPTNCWVRRAAYDPSGGHFGQVLVNLCRSDSVTVTNSKARPKTPETERGSGQPAIDPKTP